MTKLAFTDKNDGYYEFELKDGEAIPAWAKEFTPTALVVPKQIVLTYKELRAAEFNLKSTGDQFAMMYDDVINKTTTWVDWQTEIKARVTK